MRDQRPAIAGLVTLPCARVRAHDGGVIDMSAAGEKRRWATPTGDPCPRSQHLDGRVDGGGDCHGCGFCLLLAGLVEPGAGGGARFAP